ncbi:hypothetical protein [Diaphorobacter nitroreducens]|uniref:hypothetical protein n=1 Tax=Diaphorobacter nitroreducens TaxID=164759 RepID=UPI0024E23DF4|nr:hypothetical protein [Diaphorobacter nitroreducens]
MKTPAATKVTTSAPNSTNSTVGEILTPRETRVIAALWASLGWIWREDVDRIAGASNGPHIVMMLRRKVTGDDGIEMEQVDAMDRDGKRCRPGRYRLTEIGRQRIVQARLQGGAA